MNDVRFTTFKQYYTYNNSVCNGPLIRLERFQLPAGNGPGANA